MRIALPLAAILALAMTAPISAQTSDDDWCSGLVDYLDSETRLSLNDEVSSLLLEGCVGYLTVTPFAGGTADGDATADSDRSAAAEDTPIEGKVDEPLDLTDGNNDFNITVTYRGSRSCDNASSYDCLPGQRLHTVWVDFEVTRGSVFYNGWDFGAFDMDGNAYEPARVVPIDASGTLDSAAGRRTTLRIGFAVPKRVKSLWLDWTTLGEGTVATWRLK